MVRPSFRLHPEAPVQSAAPDTSPSSTDCNSFVIQSLSLRARPQLLIGTR
jgi:hypothetical protein